MKSRMLLTLMAMLFIALLIAPAASAQELIHTDVLRLYGFQNEVREEVPYFVDEATSEPLPLAWFGCTVRNTNSNGTLRGTINTGVTRTLLAAAGVDEIFPTFYEDAVSGSTFKLDWASSATSGFGEFDISIYDMTGVE